MQAKTSLPLSLSLQLQPQQCPLPENAREDCQTIVESKVGEDRISIATTSSCTIPQETTATETNGALDTVDLPDVPVMPARVFQQFPLNDLRNRPPASFEEYDCEFESDIRTPTDVVLQ